MSMCSFSFLLFHRAGAGGSVYLALIARAEEAYLSAVLSAVAVSVVYPSLAASRSIGYLSSVPPFESSSAADGCYVNDVSFCCVRSGLDPNLEPSLVALN